MAHFPPEFLDEVLARTDVVELIARHVELKKSGHNFMGLCPFHHEKTPSFSVSADKQLYYCFGCGKGGGPFQFLMEHDGMSFPEAVEMLAEKAGLEVPRSNVQPDEDRRRRRALELLSKVRGIFVKTLASAEGNKARDYLTGRGLPERIWQEYGLGFAPAGYGFMERHFGSDTQMLARLEAVGVLFKGDRGFGDRFRERVMFPIGDRKGMTVGFGGRLLADGEPKYLNSPETPYFQKSRLLYGLAEHREHIRKMDQLLVVEGYMDVLMMAAHGLPVALAPLGTAIGEVQIRDILRLNAAPVFCFDGDRAGYQAAWRALERMLPLITAEHGPRFLFLPQGEDPDSLIGKEGAEAFQSRLGESRPVLETLLAGLKRMAGEGPQGRARMAKRADSMLAQMQDNYLRQAWRQEVETATNIRLNAAGSRKPASGSTLRQGVGLEERFLTALVQKPERLGNLPEDARDFFLDDECLHAIYTRALQIAGDKDVIARLTRDFSNEQRIPRWANQPQLGDMDYAGILLDMQVRQVKRLMRESRNDIGKAAQLKKRLQQLEKRRIERVKNAQKVEGT